MSEEPARPELRDAGDAPAACPACGCGTPGPALAIERSRILICPRCGLGATRPVPAAAIDPVGKYDHSLWEASVRRLEDFRRYARPMIAHVKRRVGTGRLLEIGSNVGAALTVAREEGFQAEGLEVNPDAAAYATRTLGIPTRCTTLEAADLPAATFDAILASHVMEHIVDLPAMLRRIKTLLRPGGIFLLVCPSYRGFIARIHRERWAGWQVHQHVWHLTPPSARLLLRGAGFTDVEVGAPHCLDHPIPPTAKGVVKKAVLRLSEWLDQADQVYASGRASRPADRAIGAG